MPESEKETIEKEIDRARDNIGSGIDQLDRKLRSSFDVQSFASEHAPELVAGGAVVGFLAGFGFPKLLRRAITLGVPVALFGYKMIKARGNGHGAHDDGV